jgi:Uma2 family endonuclease
MTAIYPLSDLDPDLVYPSSDGQPLAETQEHVDAIFAVVSVLRQYLSDRCAIVLSNQFLYYLQGSPHYRVAPDVMVIFDVEPGSRDNYKIWEEGQEPSVIFEMTSKGTRMEDQRFKKGLYEELGVQEYWMFDPRGEWLPDQLQGFRLTSMQVGGVQRSLYVPIEDGISQPLGLRLSVEGKLIRFTCVDTGERLLRSDELAEKVNSLEEQLARYKERFGSLDS